MGRALWLLGRGFSPREIFLWGLLDPRVAWGDLRRYVSKERFLDFQARISPPSHAVLLEDKGTFHALCDQFDIPTPEAFAFLCDQGVWTVQRDFCDGVAGLVRVIGQMGDTEFVLKPCDGVYGRDIRAITLQEGALYSDGVRVSPAELLRSLTPGTQYVLERRVHNHPDIESITGVRTLQALRVVTVLSERATGRATIASASWRVVASETIADNFDYGAGGNMRAGLDPETGEIVRVIRAAPSGFGTEEVVDHPRTGVPLLGRRMPSWPEVRDLLERKAACFRPIRLVGWDIAITDDGPVFLEGNFWFDPGDNAFGTVAEFMERVETDQFAPTTDVRPHRAWARG